SLQCRRLGKKRRTQNQREQKIIDVFHNRPRRDQFSPATVAIPILHGDNVITCFPGDAVNIGSTPPTIVIAVTSPETVPSVEIRMTASPFWKADDGAGAIAPNEC